MKYVDYRSAPQPLRDYLTYMETIKGKSPKTVQEYYTDLRTFFRFLKMDRGLIDPGTLFEQISIHDIDLSFIASITLSDAYNFLNYCKTERSNNSATRARKVCCLRGFFKYLTVKTGQLEENPLAELDSPKLKSSLPKYLTLEQSMELLEGIDGPYRERDYCIITLFLNCGMRLSELVGINLSDLSLQEGTLRVTGKGNKERMLFLNDACRAALKEYLKVRPVDGVPQKEKNALFLSRLNHRISPKTVQHIVYSNLEKCGLGSQGYSVHKLRHTAATLMYQHGGTDIRVLKEILGHSNLGTTEIYTHLANEQMTTAAQSNPLSRVSSPKKKPPKDE